MAFLLPTFNLTVEIFTGPYTARVSRGTSPANLAFGKRVQQGWLDQFDPQANVGNPQPLLLLPALTDIRSQVLTGVNDLVEVPQSSGRWYSVSSVEDIGKGFSNEHRCASLQQISEYVNALHYAGLFWPVPMP